MGVMPPPPSSIDIIRHKENNVCDVNVTEDNGSVVMYLEGKGYIFICDGCSVTLMCIDIYNDIVISIKRWW